MVVHQGAFSVEIVDTYHRQKCTEHPNNNNNNNSSSSSGGSETTLVHVNPRADYYVRLQIVGGDDPDRVFLLYVNVNGVYIRHKQILSGRHGYIDVGLPSASPYATTTVSGTNNNSHINDPIQFQEAKLSAKAHTSRLIEEVPFHTDRVLMGTVTVKIYEGVKERHSSAFGNNYYGENAYEPGNYVGMVNLDCCASPEEGRTFLSMDEAALLDRALMKRSNTSTVGADAAIDTSLPSAKKMRTEHGFVAVQNTG